MPGFSTKKTRLRVRSKTRNAKMKQLQFQPVIKKVDVEEIKKSFGSKPAKKAEKKEEAPKAEAAVVEQPEVKEEPKKETAAEAKKESKAKKAEETPAQEDKEVKAEKAEESSEEKPEKE